jgi:hypothetical protein
MNNKRVNFLKFGAFGVALLVIALPAMSTEKEKWESFRLTDCCHQLYSASSELNAPEDRKIPGKYGAQNLFDGNPASCWVEGEPDSGISQSVMVGLRIIPEKLKIINGYGKNTALFQKNNRIKGMRITCFAAFSIEGHATELATDFEALQFPVEKSITLADRVEEQEIPFPFGRTEIQNFLDKAESSFFRRHKGLVSEKVQRFLIVSCKIQSVYRGSKWNDTCLSELSFTFPKSISRKLAPVRAISTDQDEHSVFLNRTDGTKDILVKDVDSIFQIVEISPDKEWVILIQMPSHPGPGRVETQYLLFNTITSKQVLPGSAHPEIGNLYGFDTENRTLFLQYENRKNGEVQLLNLSELQ